MLVAETPHKSEVGEAGELMGPRRRGNKQKDWGRGGGEGGGRGVGVGGGGGYR